MLSLYAGNLHEDRTSSVPQLSIVFRVQLSMSDKQPNYVMTLARMKHLPLASTECFDIVDNQRSARCVTFPVRKDLNS